MRSIMPTPRTVDIALTGRCNLKCRYCFYADEMLALQDLPLDTWLSFLEDLNRMRVVNVVLTGGEVFTRPDLFEIIDGVVANHMRYALLSNGTLITERLLEKFTIGKRLQRLDHIQVSIDGATADIHDRSRPNSFDRAIRGLRLLKEAGFPVTTRVTINQHNLHDLENIAHLLLEDIGLPSFSTNEATPIGAGCANRDDISLTPLQMIEAMDAIRDLLKKYPSRLLATAGPQAKIEMYSEMEHTRSTGKKTQRWGMGYLTGCGCVFARLGVLHDGTIVPCHLLHHQALGNIQTDSIEDIWLNHPIMTAMRNRRDISMHEVQGCQQCDWNLQCNGGCPGLAYELTGDFNRANPDDCYRNFLSATGDHHVLSS